MQPDPHYRQPTAYEYGDLRHIQLHSILSANAILWSYEVMGADGQRSICGGFPGPFEALAAVLHAAKQGEP